MKDGLGRHADDLLLCSFSSVTLRSVFPWTEIARSGEDSQPMTKSSFHDRRKAAQAANAAANDRRHQSRHDGAGLVAEIAGQILAVSDVSTGGLAVQSPDLKVGGRVRVVLSRTGGGDGVATECEVVGRSGDKAHLAFMRPTLPLLRLIVAHVSAVTGITPHLLKFD